MKAKYEEGGQPGYGRIVLSEAIFPGSPWNIAIQRSSDQNYLTVSKGKAWVGETIYLPVDGEALADGTLAIAVGKEVVDNLDPQEQYAISLRGDGQDVKGRLRINGITYSAAGRLGVPPEKEQQPEPAQQEAQKTPVQEAGPLEMPQSAASVSPKIWRWAIPALLVIGCAAWLLLEPRRERAPEPAFPKVERPAPQAAGAEEQVRWFFTAGSGTPQAAAALAAELPRKTDADKDAIYRLWYFAAENGENSVLPMYGNALDPSTPKFGSIEKNGAEAWNIYKKWQTIEPEKADAALQRLASWLARETSQGNAHARDWLFRIDPNKPAASGQHP